MFNPQTPIFLKILKMTSGNPCWERVSSNPQKPPFLEKLDGVKMCTFKLEKNFPNTFLKIVGVLGVLGVRPLIIIKKKIFIYIKSLYIKHLEHFVISKTA